MPALAERSGLQDLDHAAGMGTPIRRPQPLARFSPSRLLAGAAGMGAPIRRPQRLTILADPEDFVPQPTLGLLHGNYLGSRAAPISPDMALPKVEPGQLPVKESRLDFGPRPRGIEPAGLRPEPTPDRRR